MKLKEAITYLSGQIKNLYPERERRSISLMVLEHLGFTKTDIVSGAELDIEPGIYQQIVSLGTELATNKPVQYILGIADFYNLKFIVNNDVLIPRQETEELADLIIKENPGRNLKILDIGTGSGCIAVTLAKYIPGSEVTATDNSRKALGIALRNSAKNMTNVIFLHDDIFHTKIEKPDYFDIVVSNPPYVTESERKLMQKNVLDFEPGEALFVPDDNPYIYYNAIGSKAKQFLKSHGRIYLEINEKYSKEISSLFGNIGYSDVRIIKDINNKDRIIRATNEPLK